MPPPVGSVENVVVVPRYHRGEGVSRSRSPLFCIFFLATSGDGVGDSRLAAYGGARLCDVCVCRLREWPHLQEIEAILARMQRSGCDENTIREARVRLEVRRVLCR